MLLRAAAWSSHACVERSATGDKWDVKGDPTEGALVVAAAKAGLDKTELDASMPRVFDILFSAETKRMITLHETPDGVVAFAKGAPEVIVPLCVWEFTGDGEQPADEARKTEILDVARRMAEEALRVLAVAFKRNATPEDADKG